MPPSWLLLLLPLTLFLYSSYVRVSLFRRICSLVVSRCSDRLRRIRSEHSFTGVCEVFGIVSRLACRPWRENHALCSVSQWLNLFSHIFFRRNSRCRFPCSPSSSSSPSSSASCVGVCVLSDSFSTRQPKEKYESGRKRKSEVNVDDVLKI